MSNENPVQKREHLLPPLKKQKGKIVRSKGMGRFNYLRNYDLLTIILLFFIFCLIGCLWEIGLHLVEEHAFVKRGTMHGPWLPIYGVGGVMILLFLRKLADRPLRLFLTTMLLCAVVEYGTSWYLEKTRGIMWWDYREKLLNLNGRICAEGLLIFGIGGCLIVYIVAPVLAEKLDHVPKAIKIMIASLLIVGFLCDFAYSRVNPNIGEGITDKREACMTPVPDNIILDNKPLSGIRLLVEFS